MNKYLKNVIQLVLLLCFTFVIFHYIFLPVKISGDSMYPTLKDSEMAIMDALHVKDDDIERFDIIVIDSHYLEKYIVKRVIGLPGEKIEYKDDKLYINDQYYPESFLDSDDAADFVADISRRKAYHSGGDSRAFENQLFPYRLYFGCDFRFG